MGRSVKDPLGCYNFNIEFRPRFSDLDAFGHVNNARFLTYFEEARVAYLSALQIFIPPASPVTIVINKAQCEYLHPVLHHHLVRVCVRTLDWRRKSFRFEYAIWLPEEDMMAAKGITWAVAYDLGQGRAALIPDAFKERMQRFEQAGVIE